MSDDESPDAAGSPIHSFEAATDTSWPPLVLLHGSSGSEIDLLPLADHLAPGAARLSLRGAVAMEGGFAFFRRFPDRRIDEADIAGRVQTLSRFLYSSYARHHFPRPPLAVGYSNGAIMSTALLLADPALFAGAVLLRPLAPFSVSHDSDLQGKPVLIVDGRHDTRRSPDDGSQVADQLRSLGAEVTHHVLPGGHALTRSDFDIARAWLEKRRPAE